MTTKKKQAEIGKALKDAFGNKPYRYPKSKKGKVLPKAVTTWAPVWKDANKFHLHPTVDRNARKPADSDTIRWVKVRIVPLRKGAR